MISNHQNRTTQQSDIKNHWQSDLDSMKKNGKYTQKTNGHTWKSPCSAPCPGLFPATLRSSVLSFLLQFKPPSLFLKTLRKTLHFLSQCCPPPLLCISDLHFQWSLLQPPFLSLFLSRLPAATFSATFSAATFFVPIFLQLQKVRLIPYGH